MAKRVFPANANVSLDEAIMWTSKPNRAAPCSTLRFLWPRLFGVFFAAAVIVLVLTTCSSGDDATLTPALPSATPGGAVTHVSVELSSFKFRPYQFEFSVGEAVEFELRSKDINHDFAVRGLDIKWVLSAGKQKTERFTFNEEGTFRLVCTLPGHEGAGMVGEIVVR